MYGRAFPLENTIIFCCGVRQRCNISLHSVLKGAVAAVQLGPTSSPSLFRSLDWYKIDPSGIFHHPLCPSILFNPMKEEIVWREMQRIRTHWRGFVVVSQRTRNSAGATFAWLPSAYVTFAVISGKGRRDVVFRHYNIMCLPASVFFSGEKVDRNSVCQCRNDPYEHFNDLATLLEKATLNCRVKVRDMAGTP